MTQWGVGLCRTCESVFTITGQLWGQNTSQAVVDMATEAHGLLRGFMPSLWDSPGLEYHPTAPPSCIPLGVSIPPKSIVKGAA